MKDPVLEMVIDSCMLLLFRCIAAHKKWEFCMIIKDYEVLSPDMCSGGTSLQDINEQLMIVVEVLGHLPLLLQTHMTK